MLRIMYEKKNHNLTLKYHLKIKRMLERLMNCTTKKKKGGKIECKFVILQMKVVMEWAETFLLPKFDSSLYNILLALGKSPLPN